MSRMFHYNGKPMTTWPVFVGCDFGCTYCHARKMALTRLRRHPRYRDGFKPQLIPVELLRKFQPGQFVFVGYMGDISFASREVVEIILDAIRENPQTTFLFCTKNPAVYLQWGVIYPDNLYLGATIESNFDYGHTEYSITKAPAPEIRFMAMEAVDHSKKFISIEPVMDFHLRTLVDWMKAIKPDIIEIGPDNYHNDLPEPENWKLRRFIEYLRQFCPNVIEKKGIERLLEGGQRWGRANWLKRS